MDSFTILFLAELSAPEVIRALQDAGLDAHGQGSDKVAVSSGDAYVWILVSKREDLEPSDFEDESEWPIPRHQLGSLFSISVRRNLESEDLAVKVADRLVTRFGGMIMWDGMDEWENRYKAYLAKK